MLILCHNSTVNGMWMEVKFEDPSPRSSPGIILTTPIDQDPFNISYSSNNKLTHVFGCCGCQHQERHAREVLPKIGQSTVGGPEVWPPESHTVGLVHRDEVYLPRGLHQYLQQIFPVTRDSFGANVEDLDLSTFQVLEDRLLIRLGRTKECCLYANLQPK